MANLPQCLCGRLSVSPSPLLYHIPKHRYVSYVRKGPSAFACSLAVQKRRSPVAFFSFPWTKKDAAQSAKSNQKRQFFWHYMQESAAFPPDSKALPQNSSKEDAACPKPFLEWTHKLTKVDWLNALLGFPKKSGLWTVPWTAETIFQVMFLWFFAFWFVGSWIIPFLAHVAGIRKDCMTYRGQALYSLVTDIAEGTIGLAILHQCLARFQPLPNEWFCISWRGNWHIDACLGCLMFPIVNRLSQINLDLLPFPSHFTASHVEQSIVARDPVAMLLYAVVVSICAPIWEEVIFRGFLLPSLTRYMSTGGSIIVSAIAFALAHFSMQRMLPLTFLGLVMGIVFVRSRNLLASMLLHSLWNGFVFLDLLR